MCSMVSAFRGLVCQQTASRRRCCCEDAFRKLHICRGLRVKLSAEYQGGFFFFNNEKQEDGFLEMAIHAFFIKTREEGRARTLWTLNQPLSGHPPCIHSFLCLRARSSDRMLRWRGARSSNEEASKSAGLLDAHTMTVRFPSAHLLELLLPRCFTS